LSYRILYIRTIATFVIVDIVMNNSHGYLGFIAQDAHVGSDVSVLRAPASGRFYQILNAVTRTRTFWGGVEHSRTLSNNYQNYKIPASWPLSVRLDRYFSLWNERVSSRE
jgi:hypothetical protein